MQPACWAIGERGFLMQPAPITDLSGAGSPLPAEAAQHLQTLADALPTLIREKTLRQTLDTLPIYAMEALATHEDVRWAERAFQIYAHLANAYVWCDGANRANHLPAGVAVPLVALGHMVERPPIVPYASTSLANWRLVDAQGDFVARNLTLVQKLIDTPDETWFHMTHAEIEMHAGGALRACRALTQSCHDDDTQAAETAMTEIIAALGRMRETFKHMPDGCSPDRYFNTLRPYLFGFDGIVYEGVAAFGGQPQTLGGQTGAQSSAIPAMKAYLRIATAG
jgi:indoleamine 2,3-dioxygenase